MGEDILRSLGQTQILYLGVLWRSSKNFLFLETIMDNSSLQTDTEAQMAAKVVFRTLRDMMPTAQIQELRS